MKSPPLNSMTRKELEQRLAEYLQEEVKTSAHCRMCGAEFTKNRRWQEFCTTKCQTTWHAKAKDVLIELLQAKIGRMEREIDELRAELAKSAGGGG